VETYEVVQLCPDPVDDSIQVLIGVRRRNSQHLESLRFQTLGLAHVAFFLFMAGAIDLYRKPGLEANEIDVIGTNGNLTAKPVPI